MKYIKTLVAISFVCFLICSIITPNVLASQGNALTEKTRIFHFPDGTSSTSPIQYTGNSEITTNLPSNATGTYHTTTSNDFTPSTPQNFTATPQHRLTDKSDIIPSSSTDAITATTTQTNPWFSIDYWADPSGSGLPSYMSGTFTAVSNTISGLSGNDCIIYEPMNVAYGSSSTSYTWYQFCLYFNSAGDVDWYVYYKPYGGDFSSYDVSNLLTYTPGHTYTFEFVTQGANTVLFHIRDVTSGSQTREQAFFNSAGTTLLYIDNGPFSPASCVEGYTSGSLSNVPSFTTTIGTGQSTYYYKPSDPDSGYARIPQGIGSNVAAVGSNIYWAMVPAKYASSYVDSGPINYGYPSDASNLANTPDTHMASIWGPNYHDGGIIFVQMPSSSSGNVYIDAYSVSGYYSNTYVYVSPDDVNYYYVTGGLIYPAPERHLWAGTYSGSFNYVAVIGYDEGYSVNLRLDSVVVL
jgi:hypothetical protein